MIRKNLLKVNHAMGFFKYSSTPKIIGFASNARNERSNNNDRASALVRPEPNAEESESESESESEYEVWMSEHPSALSSFEEMMNIAKGKRIVVFSDYDGTLSPIVDDPDSAFMSDAMRSAVHKVSRYFPTAIISGRSRDKVYKFVQLNDVYYAGSHGMDIMVPSKRYKSGYNKYHTQAFDKNGNEVIIFEPAKEFLPEILQIYKELEEETKVIEGVIVEDNRFCISVHFRRAKEEDYSVVEKTVISVLAKHSHFCLTRGRKVLEIRPSIKWNKGNAVEYLIETLGFADHVFPIYMGDDTSDEDAFKIIEKRGHGFPILVSMKPKNTRASYSLRDPSEVLSFLLRLARWRRNSLSTKLVT